MTNVGGSWIQEMPTKSPSREIHIFGLSLRLGLANELPKVLDRLMPQGPQAETKGCQKQKSH